MAPHDVPAEGDHGLDLRIRIVRQTAGMAGIGDLDADRARIDVGFAGPVRRAGMPGAAILRNERQHAAVLVDEIVRGDLALRIA